MNGQLCDTCGALADGYLMTEDGEITSILCERCAVGDEECEAVRETIQ